MSERKPVPGSLFRQDSGVFSAEATPVTPSQPELPPAANPPQLPPIRESAGSLDEEVLARSLEAVAMDREAANASDGQQPESVSSCALPLRRSSLSQIPELSRPSRPTSLAPALDNDPDSLRHFVPRSPEAPQPTIALTPLLASLNLDDISNFSPEQFSSIQQRAQEIVQREVPHEGGPGSAAATAVPSVCPGASLPHRDLTTPDVPDHQIYPRQRLLFPVNPNMVQCGRDGKYYENRDYDRTDTDLLGEGGFGMVYACRDKSLKTLFAIKKNNKEDSIASMQQECQMMSTIGAHANITMFIGALEDDYSNVSQMSRREWKMLLELADNGNLSEMLVDPDTREPLGLPVDQSLYYLQQILYAVYYLHQRQFLHLDLKCKNILVFNDGRRVKLTDFGSALRIGVEDGMYQSLMGFTPNFTAPEVVRNEPPSFSADVWSVMCVLVEMLTGKLPWCFTKELERVNLILLVGRYENRMIDQLVPFGDLELDDSVVNLFRSVLITDCSRRPTALDLLRLSIIRDAHEYEKFFDECQYGYEDEELPMVPIQEVPATGAMTTDDLEERHLQMPIPDTRSNASVEITNALSTDLLEERRSSISCPPSIEHQRVSVDSGRFSMSGRASTSSSSGASSCVMSPEGSNGKLLQSQPARTNSCPSITQTMHVPSLISAQFQDDSVEEREEIDTPCHLLGGDTETDSGRTVRRHLKRTSSEHYVSNGPDVDSPEGRRAQQSLLSVGCNGSHSKGVPSVYHPPNLSWTEVERPACSAAVPEKLREGNGQPLLVARGLTVSRDKDKALTMKSVL